MKTCIAVCLTALLLIGCSRSGAIVVGSKNFTEQLILGEIAAQQIERKLHVKVERKLNLGGTLLTHEAILKGDIDIYPEYTGTGASVVLKQQVPADPAQAYITVKDVYFRRFHLVWLPPLGFNDTFAMVVRREDAKRLSAANLSAATSRAWRLGIGYEFLTRPDGLTKLNKIYPMRWEGNAKSMDLGLLYQALEQRRVDMAAGNSTDAQLSDPRMVALTDDRKAFPPYNACFVARESLLQQKPEVRLALILLEDRISDETMRELNRRVEAEHQPITKVARDFLASQP
ncbi:MAG: ABC transporter substrate-binding protein [Acidobacteriota bacterium]|nr:ABC transporter substrate-binding protein [Acidobacteriota bacterium]